MKIQGQRSGRLCQGFSLIELIGVLAILAILVGLLLSKMFVAISQAQFTVAVSIILGIKNATISYYGRFGEGMGTSSPRPTTRPRSPGRAKSS